MNGRIPIIVPLPLFTEMAGIQKELDGDDPVPYSIMDVSMVQDQSLVQVGFQRVDHVDILNMSADGWRYLFDCDFVYGSDVLEQIPLEWTMFVIHQLHSVAHVGLFFNINFMLDPFGPPAVNPKSSFTWWRDHFRALGGLRECRDLITRGVYFLEG